MVQEGMPELTGSSEMLTFMEDALRQLEQAQGCVDPQARAQLDRLRQQTAALSKAGGQQQQQDLTSPQPVDELAIAGQLDSLDGQLKDLEAQIADADPATQQLFRHSTAVWLQQQQQSEQQQQHRQPPS
ncbi:hypothetical protein ABBQ32_008560 [Trebouxia sp. C0010 RCD-2024]